MKNSEKEPATIRIASPGDLASAIPYLLGFHPHESLVIVGSRAKGGAMAARLDLAPVPDAYRAAANAFRNHAGCESVLLAGYGSADQVTPAVDAASEVLTHYGLEIHEIIRVCDGRYWSLTCTSPACCSPDGVPFDASTSQAAAAAVYAGCVTRPSREDLVDSLAPVTGDGRMHMAKATKEAERRLCPTSMKRPVPTPPATTEHLSRIHEVADQARAGEPLNDMEVAEVGVLLASLQLRDEMCERVIADADDAVAMRHHLDFWSDVLRRVERRYTPAPASLLAFTAYLEGEGALANAALDRALEVDTTYKIACILREIVRAGIPPKGLRALLASHLGTE